MSEEPSASEESPNALTLDDFRRLIATVEEDVGVPHGFLEQIWHDDDWSLVIKLHALLESALGSCVLGALGNANLTKFVTGLPLRGSRSKLALARALGLLDESTARFLDELATLRNAFAHDPTHAGYTLQRYFASLKPEDAAKSKAALLLVRVADSSEIESTNQADRLDLWFTGLFTVARFGAHRFGQQLDAEIRAHFDEEKRRAIDRILSGDEGSAAD